MEAARAGGKPTRRGRTRTPSVAVVVTSHNQGRFLRDALESVFAQTVKPDRVLLVDVGSTDDTAAVAAGYPVEFIQLGHVGVSIARNTAAEAVDTDLIHFLDGDDRLLPRALQAGIEAFSWTPGCAFACGGHRQVDVDLKPITGLLHPTLPLTYEDLLRRNTVGMHGVTLYDRQKLLDAGGFEPGLRAAEDYDLFLRLAREHPIASYAEQIGEYRKHGENTSNRAWLMLTRILKVHGRHRRYAAADPALRKAWRAGRSHWAGYYLLQLARLWRDQCLGRRRASNTSHGVN
jgi:glycosyltransferase involved in cell wall biosynthesis